MRSSSHTHQDARHLLPRLHQAADNEGALRLAVVIVTPLQLLPAIAAAAPAPADFSEVASPLEGASGTVARTSIT